MVRLLSVRCLTGELKIVERWGFGELDIGGPEKKTGTREGELDIKQVVKLKKRDLKSRKNLTKSDLSQRSENTWVISAKKHFQPHIFQPIFFSSQIFFKQRKVLARFGYI